MDALCASDFGNKNECQNEQGKHCVELWRIHCFRICILAISGHKLSFATLYNAVVNEALFCIALLPALDQAC